MAEPFLLQLHEVGTSDLQTAKLYRWLSPISRYIAAASAITLGVFAANTDAIVHNPFNFISVFGIPALGAIVGLPHGLWVAWHTRATRQQSYYARGETALFSAVAMMRHQLREPAHPSDDVRAQGSSYLKR